MKTHKLLSRTCRLLVFLAVLVLSSAVLKAETVYEPTVVYTIPWAAPHGNDAGGLSTVWNQVPTSPDVVDNGQPPGPWAVSNAGVLVIFDNINGRLNRYDASGEFLASFDCHDNAAGWPVGEIAIADTGEVAVGTAIPQDMPGSLGDIYSIVLLDSEMQQVASVQMPSRPGSLHGVFPSDEDYFYLLYTTRAETLTLRRYVTWNERQLYKCCYDGSLERQQVVWSGYSDAQDALCCDYVSPDGQVTDWPIDSYRYSYQRIGDSTVERRDPLGNLDYTLVVEDDPDWDLMYTFANYYVMRNGDIYALHATDDGAVLTKYTLVTE